MRSDRIQTQLNSLNTVPVLSASLCLKRKSWFLTPEFWPFPFVSASQCKRVTHWLFLGYLVLCSVNHAVWPILPFLEIVVFDEMQKLSKDSSTRTQQQKIGFPTLFFQIIKVTVRNKPGTQRVLAWVPWSLGNAFPGPARACFHSFPYTQGVEEPCFWPQNPVWLVENSTLITRILSAISFLNSNALCISFRVSTHTDQR